VKNIAARVVLVVAVMGGSGCGDKSPKEHCQDLVDMICDRIVECLADARGMHDACVRGFESVQSCSSVKSIGETFDDCMDQIDARSCQSLFPTVSGGMASISLPQACSGVLSDHSSRSAAATHWAEAPLSETIRVVVQVTGDGDRASP